MARSIPTTTAATKRKVAVGAKASRPAPMTAKERKLREQVAALRERVAELKNGIAEWRIVAASLLEAIEHMEQTAKEAAVAASKEADRRRHIWDPFFTRGKDRRRK